MKDKSPQSIKDRQNKLREKIAKAKQELARLQDKRRNDIGKLACRHGLDHYDDKLLNQHFEKLAKELAHADSN